QAMLDLTVGLKLVAQFRGRVTRFNRRRWLRRRGGSHTALTTIRIYGVQKTRWIIRTLDLYMHMGVIDFPLFGAALAPAAVSSAIHFPNLCTHPYLSAVFHRCT